MKTNFNDTRKKLRGGAALQAMALFGAGLMYAMPAYAQTADTTQSTQDCSDTDANGVCDSQEAASRPGAEAAANTAQDIVVTGSILRTQQENASPVTTINTDALASRGETTVEEAIQNLASNGAGALPNSFTANGAFAAGASAASLRGLTTSSTLVLFDGLRAAYYPLADDGTRNFVDLNTIPDAIVDRIEVLKDGASSTYGADAVAGVINVITKRQVTGLHLGAEAGISERGDAGQRNLEATYGFGDLDKDGFNVYVSGRYFKSDQLRNSERGSPYGNRGNYICNDDKSDCLSILQQGIYNGLEFNGDFAGPYGLSDGYFYSRPYSAPGTSAGNYELLNPAAGCAGSPVVNTGDPLLATACEFDLTNKFSFIQPDQERINASMRATAELTDSIEGYVEINYARSDVSYSGYGASAIRSSAPAETGITFNVSPLYLPIYVCPGATPNAAGAPYDNGCNAANGTLNPNNPYAANGQYARILGNLGDIPETSRYKTDVYRAAFGLNGEFADGWFFNLGGTAMKEELERTLGGRVYIANFLQVVADGSYNFMDPSQNTDAIRNFVAPTIRNISTSELYQLDGSISRDLFSLPGGPLQVGIGGSVRHEAVNAPPADSDGTTDPTLVNPVQRYTSRVNPFGSEGSRTVWSVYGEAEAPIIDPLTINLSARYDHYSTGQHYLSPKVGARFRPIPEIMIRGTYSRGFRIGSFAEFGALPTTGYINGTGTIPQELIDQYKAANGGTIPGYISNYSLGQTQTGNPNLKPEKSENWTAGIVAEPIQGVSFTVDYWQIKKKDLITGADYLPALAAYYAGQPIPDGFTVTPDDASTDPALAGLLPRVQFVQYSFTNKDSSVARGVDFAASGTFNVTNNVRFSSSLSATYLIELSQTADGVKQEYQGSLGPYAITSGSGSPQWRGNWQNRVDFDNAYLSLTGYYSDSYTTMAEDATGAGTKDDCDYSLAATYLISGEPYQCKVKSFIYFNLAAGVKVQDQFTFYLNVNNLFDAKAPIDTATYGGHNYNPAWANSGVIGRYFKVGVKADF